VGSAQLREGGALLQHGSLLLGGRQTVVREVTRGGAPPDLAGALAETAAGGLDVGEVADAVARAASQRWRGPWERCAPDAALLAETAAHAVRFRSPDWTWRA
jgi:lipoate-protein ligase A